MCHQQYMNLRMWSLVGLMLSIYTTYVEVRTEQDENYEAFCDISEKISCTKAFSSRFGKSFGIINLILGDDDHFQWNPPNGVIGMIFYSFLFLTAKFKNHTLCRLQLLLCSFANAMSIYLAYLLIFILDDLCIVCVAVYFVNFICFLERYNNYNKNWPHNHQIIVNEFNVKKAE